MGSASALPEIMGFFHFADRLFLLAGRGAEIGAAVFFAIHAWNRTLSRDGA